MSWINCVINDVKVGDWIRLRKKDVESDTPILAEVFVCEVKAITAVFDDHDDVFITNTCGVVYKIKKTNPIGLSRWK